MESPLISLPGLLLMFVLGLRRGLDPDHIAMTHAMAYRSLAQRPRLAIRIGTPFALGHGLTVALISVTMGVVLADAHLFAAHIEPYFLPALYGTA